MPETLIERNTACKGICMNNLRYKTDPSCPTKRKKYWINTLKTKVYMRLNSDFDNSF